MISAAFEETAPSVAPAHNLSPYPDALLDELEASLGNPGTEYDLQESVQLAFLAAVQLLGLTNRFWTYKVAALKTSPG